MIVLRDYQEAAVDAVFKYFGDGGVGNPLVALPTGTGKSIVIGELMRRAYLGYPGQRFIMLTHVKELIAQNYQKMMDLWPTAPAGIYSAGLGQKEACYPITFAGIASAIKNPELFGRQDLAFIDEAHLVSPKHGTMYQIFLDHLRQVNPKLKVIGFTATHYRLGQGMLTEGEDRLFTDTCFDMTELEPFNWLLEQSYLAPLVPKRTNTELNVDDVRVQGGEYVQKDLQLAVDRNEITRACLEEMCTLGRDRGHWLIFASGIDHTVHVKEMLVTMGVAATCVHSKMDDGLRDSAIAGFKAGQFRAMVNNGILTTGFDFPEIDLIGMLRPTTSPGLWVQMLGRGTRPVYALGYDVTTREGRFAAQAAGPKRNCLVLDFAGNTRRLGPINDPVLPRRKGKGTGAAPVKTCEVCGTYNHASVRFCINCGNEFHRQVKIAQGASTESLIAESMPKVEPFAVDRVTYSKYQKLGSDKPPSMKVSYYCGLRLFEEWVCLEHFGYASKKARDWWRVSTGGTEPPQTTDEALGRLNEVRAPRVIKVWLNKHYPEVINREFNQ